MDVVKASEDTSRQFRSERIPYPVFSLCAVSVLLLDDVFIKFGLERAARLINCSPFVNH